MEKILLPRGYGRSYDACKHAIENNCDIVAPDRAGVIALTYIIQDVCKATDLLELYRITCVGDIIYSAIVIRHERNKTDSVEIRLYDVWQYFEYEKTERGRRQDVVFDDVDRCMQVLFPKRKISMVTMEVEG